VNKLRAAGLALLLISAVIMLQAQEAPAAAKATVVARPTGTPPTGLDDPVWGKAKDVAIAFEGKEQFEGKKLTLTAKALYTADSIYFLLRWPDAIQSMSKGAWQFNGQGWTHLQGNEDRLAILFEIDRIQNFATKGCTVVCHSDPHVPQKEWKFATANSTERGDLWHWKAARSDPYGYADDSYLTAADGPTGRKSDAGAGGDKRNESEDKTRPAFMPDPARKDRGAILLAEEATPIKDYSAFRTGDVITYQMPLKPAGSRADIAALSRHTDGFWTLMLARKLETGNEDDVTFNTKRRYSFAMAIFDDSGDEHSYDSEVLTLEFGR
jgi:hypothetical protein